MDVCVRAKERAAKPGERGPGEGGGVGKKDWPEGGKESGSDETEKPENQSKFHSKTSLRKNQQRGPTRHKKKGNISLGAPVLKIGPEKGRGGWCGGGEKTLRAQNRRPRC